MSSNDSKTRYALNHPQISLKSGLTLLISTRSVRALLSSFTPLIQFSWFSCCAAVEPNYHQHMSTNWGGYFSYENSRLILISHFSGPNSIFFFKYHKFEMGNGMWAFKILISNFLLPISHIPHQIFYFSHSFISFDFADVWSPWLKFLFLIECI